MTRETSEQGHRDDSQLGQLSPEIIAAAERKFGPGQLDADLERVSSNYAATMRAVQVLEFALRVAGPALKLDVHDPKTDEELSAARFRRFARAINRLHAWPNELPQPEGLLEQLESAQKRRNFLAHDFWIEAIPQLLAGHVEEWDRQLQDDKNLFASLLEELTPVFVFALERRGIAISEMNQFTSALAWLQLNQPDLLSGLSLRDDGDEVLQRVATAFGIS